LLPFNTACDMVRMLPKLLDRGDNTELFCRLSIFLLRVHHAPLVANQALLKHMIQIQAKATMRLNELRVSNKYYHKMIDLEIQ
jgi:U3 small nucleolar RNA-associated protein 12